MRGFKPGCSPSRKKYAQGGLITGPGTGVSDDIDMTMPTGSYVMPADSTQAIGPDALRQMGEQPVSVSNGEYQLPPEQVHAIGVQTLDNLKGATHDMQAAPPMQAAGFMPRAMFADGGVVDDERLRRQRTIFVDQQGRATNALPSQGTGLATVPGRSATGTGMVATAAQKATGTGMSAPQPVQQPGPKFNAQTAGPTITGGPGPSGGGARGFQPREGRSSPPNRDWQARAEGLARAKQDTAAYQASRAAQDAKFATAANPRGAAQAAGQALLGVAESPVMRRAGAVGAGLSAVPEIANTAEVATDPQSTGIDTATQAAEGVARLGGTGAGAALGAKVGGALGAFGGPFAPVTIPAGMVLGGAAGGLAGNALADKAIRTGRELAGVDPSSPIDRTRAREMAALDAMPQEQQYEDYYEPTPEQLPNDVRRVGNSFSGTNIGPGYTINGQPAAGADPLVYHADNPSLAGAQNQLAKQRLFERTPEAEAGLPGGGPGAQPAGGTAVAAGFRPGGGSGGGSARLIRNSGTPSNGEILRERMRNQREVLAQRGQQIAGDQSIRQQAVDLQGRTVDAKLQSQQADRAVAMRTAARMEALRDRYDKAQSQEERASIALAIRDLLGQARPDYQIAKADRLSDPGDPMSQVLSESYIIDPATGEARPVQGGAASTPVPSQNHIAALLQNPTLAAQFDERYGRGAAARYGVQ